MASSYCALGVVFLYLIQLNRWEAGYLFNFILHSCRFERDNQVEKGKKGWNLCVVVMFLIAGKKKFLPSLNWEFGIFYVLYACRNSVPSLMNRHEFCLLDWQFSFIRWWERPFKTLWMKVGTKMAFLKQ